MRACALDATLTRTERRRKSERFLYEKPDADKSVPRVVPGSSLGQHEILQFSLSLICATSTRSNGHRYLRLRLRCGIDLTDSEI